MNFEADNIAAISSAVAAFISGITVMVSLQSMKYVAKQENFERRLEIYHMMKSLQLIDIEEYQQASPADKLTTLLSNPILNRVNDINDKIDKITILIDSIDILWERKGIRYKHRKYISAIQEFLQAYITLIHYLRDYDESQDELLKNDLAEIEGAFFTCYKYFFGTEETTDSKILKKFESFVADCKQKRVPFSKFKDSIRL